MSFLRPASVDANFYPRPPRGGRHCRFCVLHLLMQISIHALREEGDLSGKKVLELEIISIHALREEGDVLHDSNSEKE